jgi:nucleoside-diphosphate-sugar epimerase
VPGKRVLVTGASGFIGGACVSEFLRHGFAVTALVHRSLPEDLQREADAGSLQLIQASITDREGLLAAVGGCGERFTAVIHCAGRASDVGRPGLFRRANLDGARNVAECVDRLNIDRLVHLSTTDVYGIHDFVDADESTPFCRRATNPYPRFKIEAERTLLQVLPSERRVILRPGIVWGPGDTTIMPRVISWLRSSPRIVHFGRWRGKNRWPLAYIGNVTRIARIATEADEARGEAYQVVDRERTTVDEYYRLIIDRFLPEKQGMAAITVPRFAGELFGRVSSALSRLLGCHHPVFEPSHYGVQVVSSNLDFSHRKSEALLRRNGLDLISREEALAAL